MILMYHFPSWIIQVIDMTNGGAERCVLEYTFYILSVLLYGGEVWGCCKQTEALEQVQLRAARIYLGVGRRHPWVVL